MVLWCTSNEEDSLLKWTRWGTGRGVLDWGRLRDEGMKQEERKDPGLSCQIL